MLQRKRNGLMPDPVFLGSVIAAQSALAYRYSRRWARAGYHPVESSLHGDRSARLTMLFALGPGLTMTIGTLLTLNIPRDSMPVWWAVGSFLTYILWRRLRAFVKTPPGYRLSYTLPTGGFCVVYIFFMAAWITFTMVYLAVLTSPYQR